MPLLLAGVCCPKLGPNQIVTKRFHRNKREPLGSWKYFYFFQILSAWFFCRRFSTEVAMVRAVPTGWVSCMFCVASLVFWQIFTIYGRIYKPGGGLVRRGGISPQKKSGALAGRLGVRPGIKDLWIYCGICITCHIDDSSLLGPKILWLDMDFAVLGILINLCLQAQ